MNLSDKIFILEAIQILGLANKPIHQVIHSLMYEKKLNTYFDVSANAVESPEYDMRVINQDGDEAPYLEVDRCTSIEGPKKKILEAYIYSEHKISVSRFEFEGRLYCCFDNHGDIWPINLNYSDIYFNKSEFPSEPDTPAYQDKNHPCYAPELDLAIQLHQAIFIDGYNSHNTNREVRISNWLNKKNPDKKLSAAAIKRLSAVINIETKDKK